MLKRIAKKALELLKAALAIVICSLNIVPVTFFLENRFGWHHDVAVAVAIALALFLYIFGWLLPVKRGVYDRLWRRSGRSATH